MLDVHPPHHPAHTWRDFLIHIATICVGLLIAIALEQTVEHIHRVREANELRRSLARETDQIIRDSASADTSLKRAYDWQQQVIRQISEAGLHNQPLGPFPPASAESYTIAADPVYRAAKASGQLALLSHDEVQAYSEVDTIIEDNHLTRQELLRAGKLLGDFVDADAFAQPPGTLPFAHASREDLQHLYSLFVSASTEQNRYRHRLRHAWGAEVAIAQGQRDLVKIEVAETQFDHLP
jgi:hypothetical protein